MACPRAFAHRFHGGRWQPLLNAPVVRPPSASASAGGDLDQPAGQQRPGADLVQHLGLTACSMGWGCCASSGC
ncbi:hypothetical protein [Cyanobium sp. Morenito 9A2]|uniref:hypothetical protein n=1 Tax=Cyanobium sp. Morenito 9A2 TaxID=2823718 RepID=UPI0020CB9A2B|nr:hypothetical protein [Cyanobium sp. Morenito 9A2]MCP9850809.1 hypothetical protein [Cyanobium sp. Morenito 9A2]